MFASVIAANKKSRLVLALFCMEILFSCSEGFSRFDPPESLAISPDANLPFSSYIAINQHRIRSILQELRFTNGAEPFGPQYPLEKVVAMRSPYELSDLPENCREAVSAANSTTDNGEGIGFLLLHGLSDSPYLLRSLADSLFQKYPCAILRGLLMPGHGTVPGDLLNIKYEQWIEEAEYGVNSFRGEVEKLYMVGYSNGSSVSIHYVDRHREDKLIAGLIMLSPGVQASSRTIAITPWLGAIVKWFGTEDDVDPAKYQSFPINAAAQFYYITKDLTSDQFEALAVPVFMAIAGDDATIDAQAAAKFFCQKTPEQRRSLIWYQSHFTSNEPQQMCAGMKIVPAKAEDLNFVNYSHISIPIAPRDSHYGINGNFRVCSHYDQGSKQYTTCKLDDENSVFGEINLVSDEPGYEGKVVRRATFNPRYDALIEEIICFIEESCSNSTHYTSGFSNSFASNNQILWFR